MYGIKKIAKLPKLRGGFLGNANVKRKKIEANFAKLTEYFTQIKISKKFRQDFMQIWQLEGNKN